MNIFQTFSGFRGRASVVRIGEINFMIVARSDAQLEILHNSLLKQVSAPFNADACKPVIVISSHLLSEPKPNHEQNDTRQSSEA